MSKISLLCVAAVGMAVLVPAAQAAITSCTPSAGYIGCRVVTYSGSDQTIAAGSTGIIPAGATVQVKAWGGGGGGGVYGTANASCGGNGGFATGSFVAANNTTYYVVVGGGGTNAVAASATMPGTSAYGGGGNVGTRTDQTNAFYATGGGGLSGVFTGASPFGITPAPSLAVPLIIAGGGGGGVGSNTVSNAGSGGGDTGFPATFSGNYAYVNSPAGNIRYVACTTGQGATNGYIQATGGAQTAGGTAGAGYDVTRMLPLNTAGTAGTQYKGGTGGNSTPPGAITSTTLMYGSGVSGSGGGGYFGGGGGSGAWGCDDTPGAGGSGYIGGVTGGSFITTPVTSTTNCRTAPNKTDVHYQANTGAGGSAAVGQNGAVVLQWTAPAPPTVTIKKISTGGLATFNFTGDNGFGSDAITTTTLGSAATGVKKSLTTAGAPTTITEAATAGYALLGATCTGLGSGGTATVNTSAGTVLLDAAATAVGSDIICTFTNSAIPLPTVTIKKISNGGTGTYSFSGNNGFGSDSITTTSAGVEATGVTKTLTASGVATTLTETIPPASTLAGASCTGMGAGGTATVDTTAGTVLLDAAATAAGSNIVCTFTNTVSASANIILAKSGPATGIVGNALPYVIKLGNSGLGNSTTTLTVLDKLPTGVSAYSTMASIGVSTVSCAPLNVAGALLTCTVNLKAALSAGAVLGTARFNINTRATAVGTIVNYASVDLTSGTNPPIPGTGCLPTASCGSASTTISAKTGSSYW